MNLPCEVPRAGYEECDETSLIQCVDCNLPYYNQSKMSVSPLMSQSLCAAQGNNGLCNNTKTDLGEKNNIPFASN